MIARHAFEQRLARNPVLRDCWILGWDYRGCFYRVTRASHHQIHLQSSVSGNNVVPARTRAQHAGQVVDVFLRCYRERQFVRATWRNSGGVAATTCESTKARQ